MILWMLNDKTEWVPIEIAGKVRIGRDEGDLLVISEDLDCPHVILSPWKDPNDRFRWLLIPASLEEKVWVNGYPIHEMKVLVHRDEIRMGYPPLQVYFSTDLPARKVRYEGGHEKQVFCVRCKGEIKEGEEIVHCPQCRLLYHQTAERGCWSYDITCIGCKRPTGMEHAWRPEPIQKVKIRNSKRQGRSDQ